MVTQKAESQLSNPLSRLRALPRACTVASGIGVAVSAPIAVAYLHHPSGGGPGDESRSAATRLTTSGTRGRETRVDALDTRHRGQPKPQRRSPVQPAQTSVRGQALDLCAAPSLSAVRDFSATPYRSINIYIGGINMGCSQPRLDPGWVRTVVRLGWGLIPTYVGLQAPYTSCACHELAPKAARSQGVAAAVDAVARARRLGIGSGNPIYFDMEQYERGPGSTPYVMAFLGAWTAELHILGYTSGVYSSVSSGIKDLIRKSGTGFHEPDDIWFANWNGRASTVDRAIPRRDWPHHQRIHQYLGEHTVSSRGASLNADVNFLDGAVVTSSSLHGRQLAIASQTSSKFLNKVVGGSRRSLILRSSSPPATSAAAISSSRSAG